MPLCGRLLNKVVKGADYVHRVLPLLPWNQWLKKRRPSTLYTEPLCTLYLTGCRQGCLYHLGSRWLPLNSALPAGIAAGGWCCPSSCYGDWAASACSPLRGGKASLAWTQWNQYHQVRIDGVKAAMAFSPFNLTPQKIQTTLFICVVHSPVRLFILL